MTDLELFEELLANAARVALTLEYGKCRVTLIEPQCPESFVTIYGLPTNAIVVKVDEFAPPHSVFANSRGECKRADFAIIAEKNGETIIVYIEMKKTKAPRQDIVKQLAGAHCFIHYCNQIGKYFWDHKGFLASAKHRFVSIGHTSIAKRPTRVEPIGKHDHPERLLKIDYAKSLQFNQIAA